MILKRQQELGILKAESIPRKEGGSSISASLNTLSLSTLKDKATGWAFFCCYYVCSDFLLNQEKVR